MAGTLQHIAKILKAETIPVDASIESLLIDSRKLTIPATTLFFALEGPRQDGHLFIKELYQRGQRYFVISKPIPEEQYPEAVFLKVDNTLKALQLIATQHRKLFDIDVIAITGSNGKTIVKEWLYQLLQADRRIVRSPKSYNSQIGVPLSVWQLSASDDLAIFEAGISKPGEMEQLETIIQPSIGVLTNIGSAHNEGFETKEQKLLEKLKLFRHCKVLITPGDDELITKNLQHLSVPVFCWGGAESNALRIISTQITTGETSIIYQYGETNFNVVIPFTDAASIENANTSCAVLLYLGLEPATIIKRMKKLHAVTMRLEFKKGINNSTIINDSYSADINALAIALDFLQQQAKGLKKTVILSDFVEQKQDTTRFYARIADLLQQHQIDRFIGIGEKMQELIPGIVDGKNYGYTVSLYSGTDEFHRQFKSSRFKDEVVLVKGARRFKFEQLVALLEQKVHQTVLEINLDAVAHNFKVFQQVLKPQTKIMVMVKAFAYGSGGTEVANLLQYQKADYLGVAYADEGVELRNGGITLPIMVLNAEEIAFDAITENMLEPDIFSLELLHAFIQHLKDAGLKNYPIHIEIETGMNRLGFSADRLLQLGEVLKNNQQVKVVSVFSHLVASEDAAEDAFSLHQYDLLNEAADHLERELGYSFLRHLANSSGILRLPRLQMDMVRLGIGLYGIGAATTPDLQPALSFRSTIAQIKHLKKGETVSYNRKGVITTNDAIIATVRIGYADGYSRRFGNGVGRMFVKNQVAPVIGTVCMDMTMIDITEIPDVQEGDEVIIFGKPQSVEQVAKSIGTIPYEIMTGISQRVKRVYWRE